MVIWQDVPIIIEHKFTHVKKIGGKLYRKFAKDYGDIPVGRFNEETGKFEECVNNRGKAYATRKRKMFRRKK